MKYSTWSIPVVVSLSVSGHAAAQNVTLLRNTVLSSNATAVTSYDTNVNVASYRHQGLLYYSGYQYVSWYNGNTRNVVVARRTFNQSTLAVGTWQWAYVNFNLASGADSHNVISMAVFAQRRPAPRRHRPTRRAALHHSYECQTCKPVLPGTIRYSAVRRVPPQAPYRASRGLVALRIRLPTPIS